MEAGACKLCADALLEDRVWKGGNNTEGCDVGSVKGSADDLELVLGTALRVFLVLLFFLLHFLHHMAFAITMHFGAALIYAEVSGNIFPVELVFSHYQGFAEGLHQHAHE
jgi:hypothetical protein